MADETDAIQSRKTRGQLGQGMVEYLLVLTVIIAMTVTAMTTISGSVGTLVNTLVTNIESVTGVSDPAQAQ